MCEEYRGFRGKRYSALGGEIAVFGVVTPCSFIDMCQIPGKLLFPSSEGESEDANIKFVVDATG
jgi:hypothetical protein